MKAFPSSLVTWLAISSFPTKVTQDACVARRPLLIPEIKATRRLGSFFPVFLVPLMVLVGLLTGHLQSVPARAIGSSSRTISVQTFDSCQHAMGGASFQLSGNGLQLHAGPAPGVGIHRLMGPPLYCPLQRGNCALTSIGCVSFVIPVPASGTATYRIKETTPAPQSVPCDGGSVCSGGPVTATVQINAAGNISATVLNIDPDRTSVTWPTQGAPYAATLTDPIVVHDFMLGNGNCDGDHDADDRLTGSPSSHCDSEKD
jgi:hypothetical protein